jgi:hypothetical protein
MADSDSEPTTPPPVRRSMNTPPPAPRKIRPVTENIQQTPMPARRRLLAINDETVEDLIPIDWDNGLNDLNNFVFYEPAPLRVKPQIGKRIKNDNHH